MGELRLLLLGKPGAGKGTQSLRIAARAGIPAISTGELIRCAIAEGTELGRRFKDYTEKGKLVPDELILAMVEERLSESDCQRGFLLDGFPRTKPQAEALEAWLQERAMALTAAVSIVVPDHVLVERAAGRRYSPSSGRTYHVKYAPPQVSGKDDVTGEDLIQRDDDREEVVRARLEEYQKKTAMLADFYRVRSLLVEVDGVASPEDVERRIAEALQPVS